MAPEKPESASQEEPVTKPVQQEPSDRGAGKPAETAGENELPADGVGGAEGQTEPASENKDGWNQAFYETLTPEQKTVYENMTDASERNMMKQSIENRRRREEEGWIVDGGDPTAEELKEAWSHIQMG